MKSCTVGVSPWQLLILFQPKTVSESWPRPQTRTWRKSRRMRSVKTSYDMSFPEKRLSTIFFSIDELFDERLHLEPPWKHPPVNPDLQEKRPGAKSHESANTMVDVDDTQVPFDALSNNHKSPFNMLEDDSKIKPRRGSVGRAHRTRLAGELCTKAGIHIVPDDAESRQVAGKMVRPCATFFAALPRQDTSGGYPRPRVLQYNDEKGFGRAWTANRQYLGITALGVWEAPSQVFDNGQRRTKNEDRMFSQHMAGISGMRWQGREFEASCRTTQRLEEEGHLQDVPAVVMAPWVWLREKLISVPAGAPVDTLRHSNHDGKSVRDVLAYQLRLSKLLLGERQRFDGRSINGSAEKQIGGTTADELLFRWGRHDGRRAGDSNFVLLGVACKMASDGRLTANHNGRELARRQLR
ncbi:hypothetical protein KCU93_g502, partial [Aureobasidium melanogenum]